MALWGAGLQWEIRRLHLERWRHEDGQQACLLMAAPVVSGCCGLERFTSVTAADCVRVWALPCRNFRTLTAPSAVQFVSLAVEPAGEVVVAGTQDDFQVSAKEGEG
jgi:hypothetical protein